VYKNHSATAVTYILRKIKLIYEKLSLKILTKIFILIFSLIFFFSQFLGVLQPCIPYGDEPPVYPKHRILPTPDQKHDVLKIQHLSSKVVNHSPKYTVSHARLSHS
jgi:hypothetical protein